VFFATALATAARGRGDDEAYLFTPAGFDRPGQPRSAVGQQAARLDIVVREQATGRPTFCRINVVGPDGHFYQPDANPLAAYSLTGEWPKTGKGNRVGKAPFRYYGRFFYSTGRCTVAVPAGLVRVEVWKGFEFRPSARTICLAAGDTRTVELTLVHTLPVASLGYHGGDPHLHFRRQSETDERTVLDLLEAEDVHYATLLAYNEPPGPYHGRMDRMDSPQFRGLGDASELVRGSYHIISGEEYRSSTYGHLNLFLRTDLALPGQDSNADNWPVYGRIGRETLAARGVALHAHGGYGQEIYADFAQGDVSGVELLQFGVYRGIGLDDWYRILNIGYRFPCVGASDYPACRALGDCRTYVAHEGVPNFREWLEGAAAGRSFVTTGPMLQLEVDGQRPGARITKQGAGPHELRIQLRAMSEVAPLTELQLIANGQVCNTKRFPAQGGRGRWLELSQTIDVAESCWIAARGLSRSPSGAPDAEAHTNPVYVYVGRKAPYRQTDLDQLVARLDGQMAIHRAREFPEKSKVLDYFQKSRDILLRIRAAGGLPTEGVPESWTRSNDTERFDPGARRSPTPSSRIGTLSGLEEPRR
jgi:hypothetical protein